VPKDTVLKNYTKVGLKADFRSWLKSKEVLQGDYGIRLMLKYERPGLLTTTAVEGTNDKETTLQIDTGWYVFELNSTDMFGSPYNFINYTN
jgi:hypothetical protein